LPSSKNLNLTDYNHQSKIKTHAIVMTHVGVINTVRTVDTPQPAMEVVHMFMCGMRWPGAQDKQATHRIKLVVQNHL
jgi:hypothetical protein